MLSAEDRERYDLQLTDLLTVCESCQTAACWLGDLLCDAACERTAKTTQKTVAELEVLAQEHPTWWVALRKAERGG